SGKIAALREPSSSPAPGPTSEAHPEETPSATNRVRPSDAARQVLKATSLRRTPVNGPPPTWQVPGRPESAPTCSDGRRMGGRIRATSAQGAGGLGLRRRAGREGRARRAALLEWNGGPAQPSGGKSPWRTSMMPSKSARRRLALMGTVVLLTGWG